MGQIRLSFFAFFIAFASFSASAQTWTTLGTGVGGTNAQVNALTIFNNDLYAAGTFTTAGGNPANKIAKWNGTTWSALAGGNAFPPNALAVYNSELYAGYYTNYIYKWNGTTWTTLTTGLGANEVFAMAVYNGELFAGGAAQINKYNGTTWATPITVTGGTSTTGPNISSMVVYGTDLYVGGNFASINGVPANNIAKWNGTTWSALGTGVAGAGLLKVSALTVYNGSLYVGGNFAMAGGLASAMIAKWDGTAWSAMGTGLNGPVSALQVHNGKLYAGGFFNFGDPWNLQNMAMWNGTAWLPFGPGTDNTVRALADFSGQLVAGGSFQNAGGNPANYIAQFTQCTTAPPPPGAMTGKDTACTGGGQTYAVPIVNGMSYIWTLPPGWTGSSTSYTISATPVLGTGSITVASVNACGSSAVVSKTVLVNATPNATVTASGPLTFCQGGSVTLTAPTATGNTYQWRNNSSPVPGGGGNTYVPTSTGNYSVRIINSACTSISSASAVVINPLPPVPTVTINVNTLSTTTTATSYQWYLNSNPILGATSTSFTATQSGSYYLIITDANGCTSQSVPQTVTVVGIDDVPGASAIRLFPNPHNGIFTVNCPANHINRMVFIDVRDISGKSVYSETIQASGAMIEKTINLAHLPAGAYALRIISENNSTVHSMIKK